MRASNRISPIQSRRRQKTVIELLRVFYTKSPLSARAKSDVAAFLASCPAAESGRGGKREKGGPPAVPAGLPFRAHVSSDLFTFPSPGAPAPENGWLAHRAPPRSSRCSG